MSQHERQLEVSEIVAKLRASDAAPLVNVLLNEPKCVTSTGRINFSEVRRHLGCSAEQVGEMLQQARAIGGG